MKTYKGYNKLPYCNTHYPKTNFTAVADTPENLRLKKNTTNQSNVVYHKEFEKDRGRFTAVADDPETLRTKKTQEQASHIAYKGTESRNQQVPIPHLPEEPSRDQEHPAAQPPPPQPKQPIQTSQSEPVYQAIYDYSAADDDEVSFVEGDLIINGEEIDAGWMTGTVKRTGLTGMLPSNYVELMK